MLKYVDAAQPFSQDSPPLITTTVQDYDTTQLKSGVKSAFMGIGMMGVMHLYFGYSQPLLVQSVMPIKNVLESKVAQIHLFGKDPTGDLKRPWKTGGLFAGAGDVIPAIRNKLIYRVQRRIKRPSRKRRNGLERLRWSKYVTKCRRSLRFYTNACISSILIPTVLRLLCVSGKGAGHNQWERNGSITKYLFR